jgi:hypothetical protein
MSYTNIVGVSNTASELITAVAPVYESTYSIPNIHDQFSL